MEFSNQVRAAVTLGHFAARGPSDRATPTVWICFEEPLAKWLCCRVVSQHKQTQKADLQCHVAWILPGNDCENLTGILIAVEHDQHWTDSASIT